MLITLLLCLTLPRARALAQDTDVFESAAANPTQYVFVVDDSGSMRDRESDPDRLAVFTVRSLVAMLDDEDQVSVFRLNAPTSREEVLPIQPLARNRAAIDRMLNVDDSAQRLPAYAGGATPCSTALDTLQTTLNSAWSDGVAQVVFFLTDGECNNGTVSPRRFLEGTKSQQQHLLRFYFMHFEGRGASRSLDEIAEATGVKRVEVSARSPTDILKPFSDALGAAQGYSTVLLQPGSARIPAHAGARRVRLLVVAPSEGPAIKLDIESTGGGGSEPRIDARSRRAGTHRFPGQAAYRYAALDYTPVRVPVSVKVQNAGSDWKVLAVPEYRMRAATRIVQGSCDTLDLDHPAKLRAVQSVDVGQDVCAIVSLVNEQGRKVQPDGVSVRAGVEYKGIDNASEQRAPTASGQTGVWTLPAPRLQSGYHSFQPYLDISLEGGRTTRLWGPAATVAASSLGLTVVPERVDFGTLTPGAGVIRSLHFSGNASQRRARLKVADRPAGHECVSYQLGGAAEGEPVAISAGQDYQIIASVGQICGESSAAADHTSTALLRLEFEPGEGGQ
ncbi:MAG: VWA domain-containing protein, partial [Armatimonadetes bacterium]|nr:VWA domain-containing protein [Armatimonadota bacterium]